MEALYGVLFLLTFLGGKVDEDDLDANTLNACVDEPSVIVSFHGSR